MKRLFVAALVLLAVGSFASAVAKPAEPKSTAPKVKAHLVKLVSYDRSATHQVMSPEEWKKLEEELKVEAKIFPEALDAVEKDWKKDEQYRRKQFPKGALTERSASTGPAMDEDKAQEKLVRMEESASKRAADEAKKQAEKDKAAKKDATAVAAEKKGQAEKQKLVDAAVEMLKAKLEQLKAGGKGAPAADAAKPGAK